MLIFRILNDIVAENSKIDPNEASIQMSTPEVDLLTPLSGRIAKRNVSRLLCKRFFVVAIAD